MKKILIVASFLGFIGFANAQEKQITNTKDVSLQKAEVKKVQPTSKNLNIHNKNLIMGSKTTPTAVKSESLKQDLNATDKTVKPVAVKKEETITTK